MNTEKEIIEEGLKILAVAPELISKFGLMPNINFPTMGGLLFWNDLAEEKGWRVQRNSLTGHCRILDSEDIRRAWGSESAIMGFFEKIVKR